MNSIASFKFDRDYFESFYAAWVAHRSRWRRFAMPLAILLLAVSTIALFLLPSYRPLAAALAVVALIEMVDAGTHRLRWLRKRLSSVATDKTAELTFADDHIRISTPNSSSTVKYKAFGSLSVTPDGIFLVPDSGVSVFVPRSAFANDGEFSLVSARLAGLAEESE